MKLNWTAIITALISAILSAYVAWQQGKSASQTNVDALVRQVNDNTIPAIESKLYDINRRLGILEGILYPGGRKDKPERLVPELKPLPRVEQRMAE